MCVFCLLLIVQSLPEFLVQNIGQNCLMYQIKYHLVIKLRKAISLTHSCPHIEIIDEKVRPFENSFAL